ncbi:MAG: hypothetical protein WA908_10845 [Pontixanthobacter sp.]
MLLASVLAFAVQVGPNPSIEPTPAIPPELEELRRREREKAPKVIIPTDPVEVCLLRAEDDPTAAVMEASDRAGRTSGLAKGQALHCLGLAQSELARWRDAADRFVAARDTVPADNIEYRARLGAMAGAALLTADDPMAALAALDTARDASQAVGFRPLTGEIALDRARAFVALQDNVQAAEALAEARRLIPESRRAWLLSAVLARRNGDLADAQSYIMQARTLAPRNAEVLLESGVIAVLSGNDELAANEWNAVLALPDQPEAAQTARSYIDQLSEATKEDS